MCKIRWNSDDFLPLCCLVDLWHFPNHVLPPGTHPPIHQFSEYLPQNWNLRSWYSCRRRDNLLLRLKGSKLVQSGHVRCLLFWNTSVLVRRPFTRQDGQVPSGGRKRREMVENVDIGIGKARCTVWFAYLRIFSVSDHLVLFIAQRPKVWFISFFYFCNRMQNMIYLIDFALSLHLPSMYPR